jgi:hypothetical protein
MKQKLNLSARDNKRHDAEQAFLDSKEFRRLAIEYCVAIFELTTEILPEDCDRFRKVLRKQMAKKLRVKRRSGVPKKLKNDNSRKSL